MCEKMEEFVKEPRPLSMDGEWSTCVNNRADRAEADRKERISWTEQQKAKRKAVKRAKWIMFGFMFGLALIVFGGVAMNYVKGFPFPMAVGLTILGVAAYMFTVGWVIGRRTR